MLYANAQYGEVSVVNPPPSADGRAPTPDTFVASPVWRAVTYYQISSLATGPNQYVLSESEALLLMDVVVDAHKHFLPLYDNQSVCAFEVEFKVQQTMREGIRGRLALKQIRPWAWGDADVCVHQDDGVYVVPEGYDADGVGLENERLHVEYYESVYEALLETVFPILVCVWVMLALLLLLLHYNDKRAREHQSHEIHMQSVASHARAERSLDDDVVRRKTERKRHKHIRHESKF